jgi:general secretion pathway protein D
MKRPSIYARSFASLLVIFCLLATPLTAFAKKGEKNYKSGLQYEAAQQWEKAAQEFTLAVAADPSNVEYQLHYRRSVFNASQMYMQQGRSLAEQRDYIGAYNAFRQAYGYDPVNELSLSEMARMLRLQREKTGESDVVNKGNEVQVSPSSYQEGTGGTPAQLTPRSTSVQQDPTLPPARIEQLRVIKYNGDLKAEIRLLAEQLGLNVIFDTQSFRTPRTVEINYSDVTTAQALDLIFLQEGLFFQKVNRRTILVADQNRRAQYQQLVIRTFYLANIRPEDARSVIAAAIPPNQGRPQTVVLPDKDTNSITIRDTPENLRLIGEILQSIDKDRAEVVMDVSIYEVSRSDLLQLGNQIGVGDSGSGGQFSLGGSSGLNILGGARDVATRVAAGTTAFGAALAIPPSLLTAFQSKNHTKLLASTQVHAFNNEESTARIGQRVPVQTAQTYPFSTGPTTTGTGTGTGTTGGVFSGGFPVIQYEPTGLTLKFQPQVFPNLDVQVKMSIESKDILGAGSLTPTFTERTITGTARIQNNRTMMIASVAQDSQSNGRRGLPLLGLIPILGRLFTSPTRNNTQVDIVIAVTPRVLRAPAITPNDEIERPSGTLQTPTNSSLEAMVREVDREDQLAAARRIPTNVVVQLPDAEPPPAYVPAPKGLITGSDSAASAQPVPAKMETAAIASPISATDISQPSNALANAIAQLTGEAPPMPTALVNKRAATPSPVEAVQSSGNRGTPSRLKLPTVTLLEKAEAAPGSSSKKQASSENSSIGEKLKAGLLGKSPVPPEPVVVEARLMPGQQEMHVGEKQRIALVFVSKEPLGNAILRLRFDPRYLAVRNVAPGNWPDAAATQPSVMQSIDPAGIIAVAISPQAGTPLKSGASVVLFLDIEAVATGESVISFDQANAQVVTSDGRAVKLQVVESRVTVK